MIARIRWMFVSSGEVGVRTARHVSRLGLLAWIGGLLAFSGCDLTGEYDKKFQQALQTSGLRAKFDQLLKGDEVDVTDSAGQGVGVRLKLPGSVDNSKVKITDKDAQAQPPFVKLPGLSST